jgi:hypothetical protein
MNPFFAPSEAAHEHRLMNIEHGGYDPAVSQAQAEHEAARRRFWISMDADDVCGEIDDDVAVQLLTLIKAQDHNGSGRLLISAMHAWADRLASREVYA